MDTGQENELDTEDEVLHRNTHWQDTESASEESFTLNLNVYEDGVYKDESSSSELIIASNDEVAENSDEIREKRNRRISFDDDIPVAFENMEDEIERQLDAKAAKSNLSVVNVKNILKSVITNEDVMAMVRHSMLNDGDGSWLTYEPKLTRAKAKELMKAQPDMTLPLFTPTKKQSECQILIDKELSEDSSDDEYKPVEDEQSEDEKSSVADSMSSPVRKVMTPTLQLSPEVRSMDAKDEDTVTNVECGTQTCWSEDGLFKIPQLRQEPTERVEENIGQRTRSKLSLNNTPLEVIESAFIPPDITTDMYDSDCDDEDWTAFLKDFALNIGDNENVDDDDVADPEYNVLADFDNQTVDEEELRVDKAVKISRKEKKVLMAEAYEPLFSDDDDFDLLQFFPSMESTDSHIPQNLPQMTDLETVVQNWDSVTPSKNSYANAPPLADNGEQSNDAGIEEAGYTEPLSPPPSPYEYTVPDISATQLAIFKQQMRQHVQILTQTCLQISCHPHLSHHAESCKSLLVNLKCLSLYKKKSNFEAENLKSAIELVNEWEKILETKPKEKCEIHHFIISERNRGEQLRKNKKPYRERLPDILMEFMANSKVFLYPLLLPEMAFRCNTSDSTYYLPPEEQLIALGLEQFVPYFESKGDLSKKEILEKVVSLLHQILLPYRTNSHTRKHIIQAKYLPNKQVGAINFYFQNGKAPETHHYVFPVKWEKALCPRLISKGNLPENWARYIYGFSKDEETILKNKKKRVKQNWSRRFAIPVLLIGDFPDLKSAEDFGYGTLDYSQLSGKIFKMLPSMPLISNINKDIVENPSSNVDLPNIVFSVGGVDRSTQTKRPHTAMSLPVLTSPVNVSNKKASPLKRVTPILKKYNCHRKGKGGNVTKGICLSGDKGVETTPGKASPRHIAPKPVVVFVPTEDIAFPEIAAREPMDASNIRRESEDNAAVSQNTSDHSVVENVASSFINADIAQNSCQNVQPCAVIDVIPQNQSGNESSLKENEKKDNEAELAALMLASSTIRGPTANLERKRKSKQQRDTDAKLALLSPEKGSATEERDYIFAHAFFKKLEGRLKNGTEEGSCSFETLVHTLNELSEEKPGHEVENLLKRILRILGPHPDLLEEFSCFLNSKQALHHGCLASHLSGIQMRDFIHKLEVYFAKQPNHVHKIMDAISDLSNRPNISLEEIKEEIVPLLKGNLILLHKLLQLLPTERPLESLMTDFEELEFGEDLDPSGDHEPVENVRLPDKELGDRFGGEGCACPCHSVSSPCVPQSEKESSRSSHCNRCGLKFVNGRVVLQTAKGIRPAKVIFDSPADFQRVVVKDAVQPPRLNKGRSRKKSKTSENKDESSSPPPKIRILQGVESEEDTSATRISDLTSSPRGSQSRASGKGARGVSSKGKDTKIISMSQKNVSSEPSQCGDSSISHKSSTSSGSDLKESSSSIGNNKNSSDIPPRILKDGGLRVTGKNIDKPDTSCYQEVENQRNSLECSSITTETSPKNDLSNSSYEPGDVNMDEIPWTREEDRIILQTFQADGGKRDALVKIRQKLPGRSVAEIASRFQKLMSLFRKMTGPTTGAEEEDIVMEKGMAENN